MDTNTCTACQRIPVIYLSLDLAIPLFGWDKALEGQGIDVTPDDVGRPSIARSDFARLVEEERAATTAQSQATEDEAPAPPGVPAIDGASPFESMAAAGLVTPSQEFGHGRGSVFEELLDQELSEGQRQAAEQRRAEELVEKAQRILDGRDP